MYYVYWIHATNHQNPYVEGYVGISNQPEKRLRAHTTDTAKVGSIKVREYVSEQGEASIQHTILNKVNTLAEAKQQEYVYRPEPNIGWNIRKGGGTTPDCTGRVHTQETIDAIATKNRLTKSTRTYESKFKGDTARWSQEQKALIGSYHKGKTITQEHKQAISDKVSGKNSPVAVSIKIMDTIDNTEYTFDTIKEAAVALGINYQTLRSANNKEQNLVYRRWQIIKGSE